MSRLGNVKVFDNNISQLFEPSAEVGREVNTITRRITYKAIAFSPKRSRVLSLSHRQSGALKSGRYVSRGQITNDAPHALWVIKGTQGPILPHGKKLIVPRKKGGRAKRDGGRNLGLRSSVRGQKANDYISRAAKVVTSTYTR